MAKYLPDWRAFLDRFGEHISVPVPMWAGLIIELLDQIDTKLEKIMSDQDTLDQFVAQLKDVFVALSHRIADLEAAHPAVDFSGLKDAVAQGQALEAPAAPAAPAADASAPAATA